MRCGLGWTGRSTIRVRTTTEDNLATAGERSFRSGRASRVELGAGTNFDKAAQAAGLIGCQVDVATSGVKVATVGVDVVVSTDSNVTLTPGDKAALQQRIGSAVNPDSSRGGIGSDGLEKSDQSTVEIDRTLNLKTSVRNDVCGIAWLAQPKARDSRADAGE